MGELSRKVRDDPARGRLAKQLRAWIADKMPGTTQTEQAHALGISTPRILASYLDATAAPSFGVLNGIYRAGIDPLVVIGIERPPPQEGLLAEICKRFDQTLPPNANGRAVVKVLAGIRAEFQEIARDASKPHKDRALATELETRLSQALAAEIEAGEL